MTFSDLIYDKFSFLMCYAREKNPRQRKWTELMHRKQKKKLLQ